MISHRESYIYDEDCKFCASETRSLIPKVNTRICPDCYSWISSSVGLVNLGIEHVKEN